MAKADLHLSIDTAVLTGALEHCERHDTSIDQLVEDLLDRFRVRESREIGPITRSLTGVAKGADVDEETYRDYLWDKYVTRGGGAGG